MFYNGNSCSYPQMRIYARPVCGRLLAWEFDQYCKSQQPALGNSALCTSLFSNGHKCGLCQTIIRTRPGCGRSIAREDSVDIASLNNQTLTPLRSAPLCFPTDRSELFTRQEFTGFGQYCNSQQPTLETSALCASIYPNVCEDNSEATSFLVNY